MIREYSVVAVCRFFASDALYTLLCARTIYEMVRSSYGRDAFSDRQPEMSLRSSVRKTRRNRRLLEGPRKLLSRVTFERTRTTRRQTILFTGLDSSSIFRTVTLFRAKDIALPLFAFPTESSHLRKVFILVERNGQVAQPFEEHRPSLQRSAIFRIVD